jgi:ATP-dependent protease ClpP protease subunit
MNEEDLGLLENGIIDLSGEVDYEMADYVRECFRILKSKGSPDITIEITSAGGDVGIGLSILDMLRLYPGKKTGKVIGFARSMAAVILQACDKRLCAKHAVMMIHHLYKNEVSLDVMRDPKKARKTLEEMEESQNWIYEVLCKRTKKRKAVIKKICEEERDLTANEALNLGLIDKVI